MDILFFAGDPSYLRRNLVNYIIFEDRDWTFEVTGEKPESLPTREINCVRCGMNADGTKLFFQNRLKQVREDTQTNKAAVMPTIYFEQRYIDLDYGRTFLALERDHWEVLEVLAFEDGWNNWHEFFYMRVLPERPGDMPLARFVRQSITKYLLRTFIRGN